MLGRTLVNSLLSVDPTLELMLVCGRDAANGEDGGGNDFVVPVESRDRVQVHGLPLQRWGKLDHGGPWREFADALKCRSVRPHAQCTSERKRQSSPKVDPPPAPLPNSHPRS